MTAGSMPAYTNTCIIFYIQRDKIGLFYRRNLFFEYHTNGGKAFIHDPRISKKPETRAHLKLKFKTTQGTIRATDAQMAPAYYLPSLNKLA